MGVIVKRIIVAADNVNEIADVIREALQRKPRFIITTGGLGPTFDDKTLEGTAKALNRKLKISGKALAMIKKKYESYVRERKMEKAELTPARVKMATIPENAEPLPNPVGTAPGVRIDVEGTVLIALPGVPSEMKSIFDETVAPLIKKEAGENTFFEESVYVNGIMESTLAPFIDQVMHDNPYVYVKSHPRGEERKPHLEIHFSTSATEPKIAKDRLKMAITRLSVLIEKAGGKVSHQRRTVN
jgi:molybdopterin-biosynthesis enzyme MoeA-like protein